MQLLDLHLHQCPARSRANPTSPVVLLHADCTQLLVMVGQA